MIETNNLYINDLLKVINNKNIQPFLFESNFFSGMAESSCNTIKNINFLVNEYLNSYKNETTDGEKVLLLFGVLQGIFAAIDSLYNIGRSTKLKKLMISINNNDVLREIKRVRNDVVGHPSYRQYADSDIGYCILDINNIKLDSINYSTYIHRNNDFEFEKRSIKITDIINNYYFEANNFLRDTLRFFDLKEHPESIQIISKISIFAYKLKNNNIDKELLNNILDEYNKLLKSNKKSRFSWRIDNIKHLLTQDTNDYIRFFTILETKKLYTLFYNFEKQINQKITYKFPKVDNVKALISFKTFIKNNHSNKLNVLHDPKHPLYSVSFLEILNDFSLYNKDKDLCNWLNEIYNKNDKIVLYVIGSYLNN